jgi:hypothetical protein
MGCLFWVAAIVPHGKPPVLRQVVVAGGALPWLAYSGR